MKPKNPSITLNNRDNLYVIGTSSGISCLGFDVCQKRSETMAKWLGVESPNESYWGTTQGYERFQELVEMCRKRCDHNNEKCPCELTSQLIGLEGKRIEVVDKWNEKRRFIVGRSTGWMPCHIERKTKRSIGGGAVMGEPFKSVKVVG